MRVMVFVKATEDSKRGMAPTPEALAAFGRGRKGEGDENTKSAPKGAAVV